MTRQRLKESSIKWEINLSLESFAQKILKKIETLAFSNKTKIISAFIPDKVSSFLNHSFKKEMLFFEKKYKFKINIIPDNDLIIPEYKIHLFDKNKKIIKKIENFKKISAKNNNIIDIGKSKKNKKKISEDLGKILWTKRKAKSN
jgi:ribonuclease E